MFIKFIIFIIAYFIISLTNVLAFSIPVENVFSDINKNYKYYNELQTFYDKGMIKPDINGKFNPRKLLNRDEFIGISMSVSCKKCISPNIAPDFIKLYTNKISFFDVLPKNKYFYCIADAKNKNVIKGYNPGFTCENGTSKSNEIPFCPNNKISLEEAIAVVLRNSGIFTIGDNQNILNQINSGVKFPNLSTDVSAKNLDGSANSFYPYLKKALNYKYKIVDINGNEKIYKLLEVKFGKIRPKKSITKEEFLRIAYVALKNNSCSTIQNNKLALKIKVLNKSCNSTKKNCSLSNLSDKTNIYDFSMQINGACNKGISSTNGYIWRFYNQNTGEQIIKYQKYINNYNFLSNGKWKIYLRVLDNCGNTGEVYNSIIINNINNTNITNNTNNTNNNTNNTNNNTNNTNNNTNNTNNNTNNITNNTNNITNNTNNINGINLLIDGSPIYGVGPLNSTFNAIVSGGVGPYDFSWDFGNGNTGFGKSIQNVFQQPGIYNVGLAITDSNGLQAFGIINIKVVAGQNCSSDSDTDGINDCIDKCPLVAGDALNNGCPILSQKCNSKSTSSCPTNYTCDNNGNTQGVCIPILNTTNGNACLTQGFTSIIYGNASCNTCPCSNALDFKSIIRKCDTIFPAITSPNGKNIYSKGKSFLIK